MAGKDARLPTQGPLKVAKTTDKTPIRDLMKALRQGQNDDG